jgi:Putative peptidoglycan binding domain
LTCGVALAFAALGANAEKGKNTGEPKRKAPPVGQGSQQVGATTGKPATAQAVHRNRTVHQIGIPAGDGKRTTVGKSTGARTPSTGSKPKRIAREQGFKPANTPRTEVTPAAHLQQNGGIRQLNTSISEAAPAVQLRQNSGVQLINSPISGTASALKFDQNKTITSLLGAADGSQLSPPSGGWKEEFNPANGPQTGGQLSPPPGGWKTEFNPANGPQTGGQLPPPQAVGPTIIPFNPTNGPQTESARNGSGLPPPPMVTSSDPANAENKSTSEIAPTVQFKQNRRIQGSEQWVDSNYEVFRKYRSEWHDRDWWRTHYSRIAFGVGGWYYRNASYWFPAWGYDPNAYYAYDGPIYAHKSLPPDQVIADVQETLQKQAYYRGQVDGLLGPPTRAALGDYQRDHNLYITSAIDSPTLQSLGMK